MKQAAKSLRENNDIVIRRADKSNVFVILDRNEYRRKINVILSDGSKFLNVSKNPCDKLQKKVNGLIDEANTYSTSQGKPNLFKKVIGDYSPGYVYGNVKTHKDGNKLRPIISQFTTPTYEISKKVDSLIKKYLPQGRMLKSSAEFVSLLSDQTSQGNIYSLDVESLFTNVPVDRTINIILDKVYNHPNIPPPPMKKSTLKELLKVCTTEVPFRDMDQNIYVQRDGVGMGSPLGVTFANFFMAEVEEQALDNIDSKPTMYGRYIDDIFVLCDDRVLVNLKNELELISGLKFTIELSVNNKLPFLNVLVKRTSAGFHTSVYRKPTDVGSCMNATGDAPEQYKLSVIKGFLHRAKTLCSDHTTMMLEVKRAKQILVNNGYLNKQVDVEVKKFLRNNPRSTPSLNIHSLYYRNFMNSNYQKDEKSLRKILNDNVKVKNEDHKVKLVIYYKTRKTRDMIMKNNLGPKVRNLAQTHVVYEYNCQIGACKHLPKSKAAYDGLTTCTLSRRLSNHLQKGAILQHCLDEHNHKITRKELEDSVSIRYKERDCNRLSILESLIIGEEDPILNRQDTGRQRILKLYGATPIRVAVINQ